jgi:hypothetical protein
MLAILETSCGELINVGKFRIGMYVDRRQILRDNRGSITIKVQVSSMLSS